MENKIIEAIRSSSQNLKDAILRTVSVEKSTRTVCVEVVTNRSFTVNDKLNAELAVHPFIPDYFTLSLEIIKLSPDCDMVKRKVIEAVAINFKAISVTMKDDDVEVKKTDGGFDYTLKVMSFVQKGDEICEKITAYLKKRFCGQFNGHVELSNRTTADIHIEEKPDEIEFEIPIRTFEIEDFGFLEGTKKQTSAVYIADLNFAGDEVVICGTVEDIRERTYTNKKGVEKVYLSLVLSDTTASVHVTYFIRQRSYDKIKNLKIGDSIVCTGSNEEYRGSLRYTANTIDYGSYPKNFVPVKRESKPVPMHYHHVSPQPFSDIEQTDFFTRNFIPECLLNNSFVVFDLETTGLNSSPVSGNMDRIIEIGAYKIENGQICQCFSTFINPQRRLSDEIIKLTGITEEMVADAPTYEDVMPDFFKFCSGSILVGHNIAGFDFKFVDYYCARLGYVLERKIIDTIPLSQELLLGLSNYKLNTIADKFKITFNHHRATDDALATAKIFIELIKIKKTLPKLT